MPLSTQRVPTVLSWGQSVRCSEPNHSCHTNLLLLVCHSVDGHTFSRGQSTAMNPTEGQSDCRLLRRPTLPEALQTNIFAATLVMQSLPFLAAAGLALIERQSTHL